MKRLSKMLVILTLLAVVFSVPVFAEQSKQGQWKTSTDVRFGAGGTWGFVYTLPIDEDGFVEEGDFVPWFNKEYWGVFNYNIQGAYLYGGQEMNTVIGSRLGVNYSPYVASFHPNSKLLGVRVFPVYLEVGPVDLVFDGAYTFGLLDRGDPDHSGGNILKPRANDVFLGVKGSVGPVDLSLAVVNYGLENDEDDDVLYNYFQNVAVELGMEVIPGLNVKALGAYYSEPGFGDDEKTGDWLYEVTANYEVIPGTFWLRAGHRNSKFEDDNWNKPAILGRDFGGGAEGRYVNDTGPIERIFKRDFSVNAGATYKFDYLGAFTTVDVDYDTTNPAVKGDMDDKVVLTTNTNYEGFKLWQSASVMFPDEETDPRQNNTIFDDEAPRFDYALKFQTPEFDLPVPVIDRIFAVGKLNLDWDSNYVEESRLHVIPAVELGIEQDVWMLHGLKLGAIVGYDLLPEGTIEGLELDPLKFALAARYAAPNDIKFTLEYLSSANYKDGSSGLHTEPLYNRYHHIRFYNDSLFHGLRFTVQFPI